MPELQAQFDRTKMKLMHFWSTGPGYFLMTPGKNVRTLADFSGKTIRAANPASVACIEALGAKTLFAPMSVALERFEANLIDGPLTRPRASVWVHMCGMLPSLHSATTSCSSR
jgi:TRAP-type C4-dicarboxylate transport system substrate-binding protein